MSLIHPSNSRPHNARRNALAATVALALTAGSPLAHAATLNPGQTGTVNQHGTIEDWYLTGAELNINAAGEVRNIDAGANSTVNANGGILRQAYLHGGSTLQSVGSHFQAVSLQGGSQAQLNGGSIGRGGLQVYDGSTADVRNMNINATGTSAGIDVSHTDSHLTLRDSTVTSATYALRVGAGGTADLDGVTLLASAPGGAYTLGADVLLGHAEVRNSDIRASRDGMQVQSGSADISATRIEGTTGQGMFIDRAIPSSTATFDPAAVTLRDSRVTGSWAGVRVRRDSTVTLSNTEVIATDKDVSGFSTGLWLEGANAHVSNGSRISGLENGVAINATSGYTGAVQFLDSSLVLDGSHVSSRDGSAILVNAFSVATPQNVDITLANGSTATGGNGVAVEVHDASLVNLNVDRSDLVGDIVVHGDRATADVSLQQASLLGRMVNTDAVTLDNRSTWQLTGDSSVTTLNLGADSRILLGDGSRFNTLTVNGDYTGAGGTMLFNTVLGDDTSASDRLVIHGDSHGQTHVLVNNIGGAGAQTVDGIQLVQVDGASNGRFDLAGRAVGGQYEYFLFQGGKTDPADGDWYLRSELATVPNPCDADPSLPGCGGTIELPDQCVIDPGLPQCKPVVPVLRPEPGAYLANQSAAVGMFQHGLHDRAGEPSFNGEHNGAWARVSRNQADYAAVGEQLEISSDTNALQVGTDLFGWGAESRGKLGVMLGTGSANSQATSKLTGYSAKGKVRGQAIGLYGTWLQNPDAATGAYVDGWLQYGRYQSSVEGQGLQKERYDARTATISAETGYAFALGASDRSAWFIQPQLQLSYSDYRSDRLVERNGTVVESDDVGGLSSRLGVRIYGHTTAAGNKVQPFVAVNWLRDGGDNAMRFDGARVQADTPASRVELKGGAQVQLGKRWTGWGDLGVQRGQDGYRNVSGQIGVRYSW